MPPSAYPALTTIRPRRFYELPPEYAVTASPQFADGGMDFNLNSDQKIRRFVIEYEGLTAAEAATLDAHVDSAAYASDVGSAYGFDFTPRGGSVLSGVRYDRGGYDRPAHSRTHIQHRRVVLIKRP